MKKSDKELDEAAVAKQAQEETTAHATIEMFHQEVDKQREAERRRREAEVRAEEHRILQTRKLSMEMALGWAHSPAGPKTGSDVIATAKAIENYLMTGENLIPGYPMNARDPDPQPSDNTTFDDTEYEIADDGQGWMRVKSRPERAISVDEEWVFMRNEWVAMPTVRVDQLVTAWA